MPIQESFSDQEFRAKRRVTRREVFLAEMERVVPWETLESLIQPHYYPNRRGRPSYPLAVMFRVHLIQNWYALSDRGLEDALYEITSLRGKGTSNSSFSKSGKADRKRGINFSKRTQQPNESQIFKRLRADSEHQVRERHLVLRLFVNRTYEPEIWTPS